MSPRKRDQVMRVETFIFVHDQEIVLAYQRAGKFAGLPEVKYVFLGAGPIDRIAGLDNVIVARTLPHNIEDCPKFTAYTGWHALGKNGLITGDYVNLFEYDINVVPTFRRTVGALLQGRPDFVGYLPLPMTGSQYIGNARWVREIIPAIRKRDGVDIRELVRRQIRAAPLSVWSATSNATFSRPCFEEYMRWFEPLIDDLRGSATCGHAHERSLSFFCLIFKKKVMFAPLLMTHLQLDSHGTQGIRVDWEASLRLLLAGA